MSTKPTSVKEYLDALPEDRRKAVRKIRAAVNKGLPKGYKEGIQYGMIGWFVPHRIFPAGYHCDPSQPVPFAGLASQKNYISLYLMCVYSDAKHRAHFEKAWKKSGKKLDMGKSCVRIKKIEDAPLDVITETVAAIPVDAFLGTYEKLIPAGSKRKR